jgi:hypothetical protein
LITEKKGDDFLKHNNIIKNLTVEVTLDLNGLSQIMNKKKCRLRSFVNGDSKVKISCDELEELVNFLVQSKIDNFIHQLDSKNITLAELYRTNKQF